MAVDSNGNVYVTGSTTSDDFPTLNAYQPMLSVPPDAFIAVLNPTGTSLLYSTYWGGSNTDSGAAIAADSTGNAYITGQTYSYNFPVVSAFQGTFAGNPYEAFVIKLGPTGKPIYSTYFGGSNPGSNGLAIAADASGSAYVAGVAGPGIPLQNPIQSTAPSDMSAFVSKFSADGSALVYSTYLGVNTYVAGIAVDSDGQAYLGGVLATNVIPEGSLPLASPIQSSFGTGTFQGQGIEDSFASVINASGSALSFSTYLGGETDGAFGFAIDGSTPTPNLYLTGVTSCSFPITNAPVTNVSNGTYVPFTAGVVDTEPCLGGQFFMLKIGLSSGTSFSYPATVDFTNLQPVGNSSPSIPVLIANTSASGDISINNIAIQGDFSQTNNCPSTLTSATSCKLMLTFTPTAGGQRTDTITITDSAPGSPHTINLLGTGAVPAVQLTPTSLTFPARAVGTTSLDQAVTLTNTGNAALAISRVSTTGDFSESNLCGFVAQQQLARSPLLSRPRRRGPAQAHLRLWTTRRAVRRP
jgi:Beta-propeller repeat/Abnormal spindle-like microcephaly-assoc'd, ASPM-SPD-2-Hydin